MIFVTVGAQMPFDRLVRTVDEWAQETARRDVFAQIGHTAFRPHLIEWTAFLGPQEFKARAREASVIIAHAGTGSILTAMQYQKPILVMPRRCELYETRNNHQVATAMRFQSLAGVSVAMDEDDLRTRLDVLSDLNRPRLVGPVASDELIAGIRSFLAGESVREDRDPAVAN